MKPLLINNNPSFKGNIYVKEVETPSLNTPLHFHNDFEIVYILKGSGRRIVGDNIENFSDGDLIVMGPNLPHVWYNENNAGAPQVKAIVVYFKQPWLNNDFIQSFQAVKLPDLIKSLNRGIKLTGSIHGKIVDKLIRLNLATGLKRAIFLLEILDILSDAQGYSFLASEGYVNSYHSWDVERMDKIYEYIMTNFNQEITLENAAAIAHMTPSSFCKYFKIRTQKTFSHFVNEIRIGHACKLLMDFNLSISQICFDSGFNNLANFNRNFKTYVKKSPREYRKSLIVKSGD